jgi:ZIP family zinc transporter
MSPVQIALLGAVAGFTIYLGLPVGRLRQPAPKVRASLNAVATGILLFLFWDVLTHAWEPIDEALADGQTGTAFGRGVILAVGLGVSLLGLVYFDRWMGRRAQRDIGVTAAAPAVPSTRSSVATDMAPAVPTTRSTAQHLAMMIAAGIGLHNFAEGLAIGSSAAAGEMTLAVLLIIGFGLHNATEGFGIVAPMAAAGERPSWGYLAVLGAVGGGPTFLGTLVGQSYTNTAVTVAFLALAAGSILYVVIEMLGVARRFNLKEVTTWALLAGLVAGFLTDAIVTAAGA